MKLKHIMATLLYILSTAVFAESIHCIGQTTKGQVVRVVLAKNAVYVNGKKHHIIAHQEHTDGSGITFITYDSDFRMAVYYGAQGDISLTFMDPRDSTSATTINLGCEVGE